MIEHCVAVEVSQPEATKQFVPFPKTESFVFPPFGRAHRKLGSVQVRKLQLYETQEIMLATDKCVFVCVCTCVPGTRFATR